MEKSHALRDQRDNTCRFSTIFAIARERWYALLVEMMSTFAGADPKAKDLTAALAGRIGQVDRLQRCQAKQGRFAIFKGCYAFENASEGEKSYFRLPTR